STYTENVNVNKRVTVDGEGASGVIVTSAAPNTATITISGTGTGSNDLTVKDLRVTGANFASFAYGNGAVTINGGASQSNITLDNLDIDTNTAVGVAISNPNTVSDLTISGTDISGNQMGVIVTT